jgi:hypothetical protein
MKDHMLRKEARMFWAEYLTKYPMDIDNLIITDYKILKRLKGKLVRRAVGIE